MGVCSGTLSGGAAGFGLYQGGELCCSAARESTRATPVPAPAAAAFPVREEGWRGRRPPTFLGGVGMEVKTRGLDGAGLRHVPCQLLRGQSRP